MAIYMEGGGDGANSKAALRQGMDVFLASLKDMARAKAWRWRLIPCGGRDSAFDGFRNAVENGDDAVVVLLVDAEGPVNGTACAHLQQRDDWNLGFASDQVVHLMVQTMEAWIVADPEAMHTYYGQGFQKTALPRAQDLETVSKAALAAALKRATRGTKKGVYHKIRHASDLLQRIDRTKVQRRCSGCDRMFKELDRAIRAG